MKHRARLEGAVVDRLRGAVLRRTRAIMVVAGTLAAGMVTCAIALDVGEVVTLQTTGDDAESHETQLWIVDLEGQRFLRAANADVRWLERLRRRPRAVLVRGGEEALVTAQPLDDPFLRERVNIAMARKYGLADRLWRVLNNCSRSVPIRLRSAGEAHASRSPTGAGGGQ